MSTYFNSIWQSKLKAAALHACLTILVALLSGSLVFYVWYPGSLAKMLGGTELFWLVLSVEISLGPLISLVIFNPKKQRNELIKDYSLVALIQLSALFYGLYVVAQSRPVFFVFVKDSFEVVTALELDDKDLQQAKGIYQHRDWLGPNFVCTESPTDPQEKSDLLFSAVEGKDIQLYPKYYRKCHNDEISSKAYNRKTLMEIVNKQYIDKDLLAKLPSDNFTWLPIKHRFGAWVAIYPSNNQSYYLSINPYESAILRE
ncbi:MAG: hypothetical protein JKY66_10975 [Spongiibacteraceae bacterium]|nr:hypothetical protein [Spongiibacteraceae bacterium]